ncbi:MAG: alpha/beta hydrolase [Planctomycetota bacterium]|nr:alpha/beta hydrolase [Planctomycetota bacterium]
MSKNRSLIVFFVSLVVFAECGCTQKLSTTPNLFVGSEENPFADVPEEFQSNEVVLYYLTDREPTTDRNGNLKYGFGRSESLALGRCVVSIGRDVPWDTLVKESRTRKRSQSLPLRVTEITEIVRAPSSVTRFVEIDGRPQPKPEILAARAETTAKIGELLTARLAMTPRKELFVFVHGFNNTFDEAAYRMAQLWHFMGRVGVPIIYTWPAGSPGLLRGYTHDRESGEFTIFHLRESLRFLAACEDVEKIHIVAHSRGTDVLLSALRELHIECRAQGVDTRKALKLGTVVLAAADLDVQVTRMRVVADGLHHVPEMMTIYLSEDDRAIGIASWLFSSARRLGQMVFGDLTAEQHESMALFPEIQFVDVDLRTDWMGHGYFISNPAVLSDLILVLRDGRMPGVEHGRPLRHVVGQFWELDRDYPQFEE